MSQAPKMQELEIPIHTELAVDLHDAEQLLFKVVQMLNRLEFKSHKQGLMFFTLRPDCYVSL